MGSRLARIMDFETLARKANYRAGTFADLCKVSTRQFERYCKITLKKTPQSWLNELRLSEAQRLLGQGLTVKEIAFSLGYKQPSHFCRQFKNLTGTTPNGFSTKRQCSAD